MPKPCPVEIHLDGRRYRGHWTLKQGDCLCVTSAWGHDMAELRGAKPEACAPKLLERIVRAYQKAQADEVNRQARELEKLRRRNERERRPT